MKKGLCLCLALTVSLSLTACASIPDMTAEQESMVSMYATSLLLKYDSENHSRLVDVNPFLTEYNTALYLFNSEEEAYYDALDEEEALRREEAKAQEELNNSYSEETLAYEPETSEEDEFYENTATVVDARSIDSFLDLFNFSIDYVDYEVVDEYPEGSDDVFVTLTSTSGHDILVVNFDVTNTSSEVETLDILSSLPTFKLAVNDDKYYSVMKTLLSEDLSVYTGAFNPGETKRLVLITEVREGAFVNSLGLRISMGDDYITKTLK